MAGADGESGAGRADGRPAGAAAGRVAAAGRSRRAVGTLVRDLRRAAAGALRGRVRRFRIAPPRRARRRSEEHTSELQSLMRISYAVFCLKKKKNTQKITEEHSN